MKKHTFNIEVIGTSASVSTTRTNGARFVREGTQGSFVGTISLKQSINYASKIYNMYKVHTNSSAFTLVPTGIRSC